MRNNLHYCQILIFKCKVLPNVSLHNNKISSKKHKYLLQTKGNSVYLLPTKTSGPLHKFKSFKRKLWIVYSDSMTLSTSHIQTRIENDLDIDHWYATWHYHCDSAVEIAWFCCGQEGKWCMRYDPSDHRHKMPSNWTTDNRLCNEPFIAIVSGVASTPFSENSRPATSWAARLSWCSRYTWSQITCKVSGP